MKYNIVLALAFVIIGVTSSCDKENDNDDTIVTAPKTGSVTLKFEHLWDNSDFTLNTEITHPQTKETITFTSLKYYISNVKLKKTDGTWYSSGDCYHLIDVAMAENPDFTIHNIPMGDYTEISYTIGIDSAKNVSGSQSGDLAVSKNMFLNFDLGYVFILAEGFSNVIPDSLFNLFNYQISGFKNLNKTNAVQINTQGFNGVLLNISPRSSPSIHFAINVELLWSDGLSLSILPMISSQGESAVKVSENFKSAFEIEHIHN